MEIDVKRYEIMVFGADFENVESVGGWQLVFADFNKDEAEVQRNNFIADFGEENVDCNW